MLEDYSERPAAEVCFNRPASHNNSTGQTSVHDSENRCLRFRFLKDHLECQFLDFPNASRIQMLTVIDLPRGPFPAGYCVVRFHT